MRILSYNIHKGFTVNNQELVLKQIRHAVRTCKADIVCLQEVVGENKKHPKQWEKWVDSQFEYLADEIWDYKSYGQNAVYDDGNHGNAVLSKVPLLHESNHNISVMPFSHRGALHTITENGLHIICAHLGLIAWERRRQIKLLLRLLDDIPEHAPLILAGDFNDWQLQSHEKLKEYGLKEALEETFGKPARTFPSRQPTLKMDRIYYRNLQLKSALCLEAKKWRVLSDHCPLLAEFTF